VGVERYVLYSTVLLKESKILLSIHTPGDKKRESSEKIKKTLKGNKSFYATDKYIY
jgi:hypothetical protein